MFKHKYIYILVILLGAVFLLVGCSNQNKKLPEAKDSAFLMDTLVQMKAYGENAEAAVAESMDRIKFLEDLMSPTIESSEVYQLNNNPEQKVKLSPETEIVLEKALYYAKLTGGKFDPTVGALVDLWGIGTENARVPDQIEIETALDNIGYQYLTIDDNHQAEIKKAGVKIDLGGIAKGFAADQVKKIVEKHNVKSAFVNLGGNVLVIGSKADGSKWRIGIQDPRKDRGNVMAIIETTDQTIVTSGNYERYFIKDGKLYHHILDPATGYPAESHLLSASIVSNSSFDADALSTAVYIMGVKAGLKFIENLPGVEAMFITDELNVYLSSGLKNKVEITSQDFNLIEGGN